MLYKYNYKNECHLTFKYFSKKWTIDLFVAYFCPIFVCVLS